MRRRLYSEWLVDQRLRVGSGPATQSLRQTVRRGAAADATATERGRFIEVQVTALGSTAVLLLLLCVSLAALADALDLDGLRTVATAVLLGLVLAHTVLLVWLHVVKHRYESRDLTVEQLAIATVAGLAGGAVAWAYLLS